MVSGVSGNCVRIRHIWVFQFGFLIFTFDNLYQCVPYLIINLLKVVLVIIIRSKERLLSVTGILKVKITSLKKCSDNNRNNRCQICIGVKNINCGFYQYIDVC